MVNMHRHAGASCVSMVLALSLGTSCGRSSRTAEQQAQGRLSALPDATCTLSGGVRSCELWARAGSVALPGGGSVAVWGYASSAAGPATLPGPTLVANEGETLEVTLHNELAQRTAVLFRGQPMPPDLSGASPGGSVTYTFPAGAPGTFLYEAGPLPGAAHQVPMGLYGALVIRPSASPLSRAYAAASTTYDDEAVVLLSEIDPALNGSDDPAAFDLRSFAPRFRLIGGKAYPATAAIPTGAGRRVLLRYVNAGVQHHSMAVLGADQTVIATDGVARVYPHRVVAETIGPGQTLDAIVTVPAATPAGARLALHEGSLVLTNDGAPGFGGMLTFLAVGGGGGGGDAAGPATSAVTLDPSVTTGDVPVALSATVSDAATGGAAVTTAEWFVDSVGAPGTGTPLAGGFGGATAAVSGALPAAQLAALPGGDHVVFVQGRDALGNWGPVNFAVLTLDKAGPTTSSAQVVPAITRGAAVTVAATADDRATGGSDIQAAEWFLDVAGAPGTGGAMTPNVAAPLASVDGVVPAAALAALAEGPHDVWIRSRDAVGAWGAATAASFVLDRTGPVASAATVTPSPSDGKTGVNSSVPAVRVTVLLTDALTNVAAGEGFIGAAGAPGSGFPLVARRGVFDGLSRTAYADVPLSTVGQLPDGSHPILLRGRDAAGNWGATTSAPMIIDRVGPVLSGVTATANPTNGPGGTATTFTLSAIATDATTTVTRAEWFEGADPGAGLGADVPVPVPAATVSLSVPIGFVALGWTPGDHAVSVRARDAAGNWSAASSIVVKVVLPSTLPNAIFADGFESGTFASWSGGATGAGISVSAAAALVGASGMQASLAAPGYVTDPTPAAERTYHARFWLDPNGAVTGATAPVDLLVGLGAAGTPVFQVQLLHPLGGAFQVRVTVARAGGTTSSRYYPITDAPHPVELAWTSSTSGQVSLYLDGGLRQTLVLDTSAAQVDAVRFGPSAVAGASGVVFLDAFASTRATVIGP
jgi:hypothetical protein